MFYNAMERKGHDPSEELMPVVVGMHNAVNERSWGQLLEWERTLHPETAESVRLKRFHGDATNISPKVAHAVAPSPGALSDGMLPPPQARLRSFMGAALPFDR